MNLDKNSISVIIPMYNSESTILRALESIKKQTSIDYIREIIIVNDGSRDNSLNVVLKFIKDNKHLNLILIDKENEGVSAARNLGINSSSGDWIAFLDSDDEWVNNKLELQGNVINENENIDFIGGEINDK